MVFSSVPPYLDHHNWHHQLQQSNHEQGSGGGENPNLTPQVPSGGGGSGGGGGEESIKPRSMIDRARLAKLPLPEPGLNCPRCDSTNTKFCYFNNYNLTQPRHFCKTCRRYWTKGGALRNVPVGGGCRKNKRNNKSTRRSKSPSYTGPKPGSVSPSRASSLENMTSTQLPHQPSFQLPFMSSLGHHYGGVGGNIGTNIGGFHAQNEMGNFQVGSGGSNGNNYSNILSIGGAENWRLPFLAGFEVPNNSANLFRYQSEGVAEPESSPLIRADMRLTNSGVENTEAAHPPVKAEENQGINLSRQFLGISENNSQQQWMGNTWVEFSGVSTSSTPTTHFL